MVDPPPQSPSIPYAHGSSSPQRNAYVRVPPDITQPRLRSGPGTSYAVKGYVVAGHYYILLETQGAWVRIDTSLGEGWVHESYVQVHIPVPQEQVGEPAEWSAMGPVATGVTPETASGDVIWGAVDRLYWGLQQDRFLDRASQAAGFSPSPRVSAVADAYSVVATSVNVMQFVSPMNQEGIRPLLLAGKETVKFACSTAVTVGATAMFTGPPGWVPALTACHF